MHRLLRRQLRRHLDEHEPLPEDLRQLLEAVSEAYGMALVEAQAAGLPVVAGREGGVPDIVAEGESGLLAPVGDALSLAVGRALMANPTLLLLDEPSEGLAPVVIDHLAVIFDHVAAQGTALLLIEQNMSLVVRVAERYCAMAKGAVVAEGLVRAHGIGELHRHVMV